MDRRFLVLIVLIGNLLLISPGIAGNPEPSNAIDAKADKILHQMSDYLNTLKHFTLHAENTLDTLLPSGQKVQIARSVDAFVRRPDRLRANIDGDFLDQEFYFDGHTITLYSKGINYYATIEALPQIEAAFDNAEEAFGLVAPVADLIYRDAYDFLISDVSSALYMGLSRVNGIECHHLAFRGEDTDWQIWIENSQTPLPRKFIITTKWVTAAPQFTAYLTHWNTAAQLEDSLFKFTPPANAQKIDFLPVKQN